MCVRPFARGPARIPAARRRRPGEASLRRPRVRSPPDHRIRPLAGALRRSPARRAAHRCAGPARPHRVPVLRLSPRARRRYTPPARWRDLSRGPTAAALALYLWGAPPRPVPRRPGAGDGVRAEPPRENTAPRRPQGRLRPPAARVRDVGRERLLRRDPRLHQPGPRRPAAAHARSAASSLLLHRKRRTAAGSRAEPPAPVSDFRRAGGGRRHVVARGPREPAHCRRCGTRKAVPGPGTAFRVRSRRLGPLGRQLSSAALRRCDCSGST